ncbi:hypothetical protein EVAR_27384_1 [Eumeta japonica]|uniref:Uncharacterized protein n=1 Tax=Eumeta variegata TaxID=151549 RepID=A0A4C1X4V6_EUMVA|nr:hypothetical protein EVAR_27384_1 [Eumeta japonica]
MLIELLHERKNNYDAECTFMECLHVACYLSACRAESGVCLRELRGVGPRLPPAPRPAPQTLANADAPLRMHPLPYAYSQIVLTWAASSTAGY